MTKKVRRGKTFRVKVLEESRAGMDYLVEVEFLTSNRPELLERLIREVVEWGLRGGDSRP